MASPVATRQRSAPALFVVEIKGEAVLVFAASDTESARDWIASPVVRAELAHQEVKGGLSWRGSEADLLVRPANGQEAWLWEDTRRRAVVNGELRPGDLEFGLFLTVTSARSGEKSATDRRRSPLPKRRLPDRQFH